jgi:hypothetical protein
MYNGCAVVLNTAIVGLAPHFRGPARHSRRGRKVRPRHRGRCPRRPRLHRVRRGKWLREGRRWINRKSVRPEDGRGHVLPGGPVGQARFRVTLTKKRFFVNPSEHLNTNVNYVQGDQIGWFRPLGDDLLWVFFCCRSTPHILASFSTGYALILADMYILGYVLGDIFHKLIWSPCLCSIKRLS